MRRLSVAELRRLALGAAVVIAVLIVVAYSWNAWQAARARRAAPAVIPSDLRQQAAGFTFSRSEKGQTLFTVRASRTKDFKETNKSLLEDVWVTIYGRQSNRSDHIHTDRCEYDAGVGLVQCTGEVKIDLEGSLGATLEGGPTVERVATNPVHIETSGVSFNQNSGVARTDQPVRFSFQLGSGRAEGITYDTRAALVELHRNVEILIRHNERGQNVPILLRASRLHYSKTERRLWVDPPLEVTQANRRLTAQNLSLYFDEQFQAERAEATGAVDATSTESGRALHLSTAQIVGFFGPHGSGIERMLASGGVHAESKSPQETSVLDAGKLELAIDPALQEAREIQASGNARYQVTLPAEQRTWSAPAISLAFRPGGRQLARGWSEGDSRLEIVPAAHPGEKRSVSGRKFEMQFDESSRLENFRALGAVRVDVVRPGQPTQTSTSDELYAVFDKAQGTLKESDQIGNFRFQEAERQARAERGHYAASSETVTLVGQPMIRDGSSQTTARLIFLNQRTGEMQAEQNVRTTYFSSSKEPAGTSSVAPAGQLFRSGEPVHLAADRLVAQRTSGHARYEGHCRLWQGENMIQAAAVELFQKEKKLIAIGKVSSIFVEQPGPEAGAARQNQKGQRPVTITAERLTYMDSERRALYEGGVMARDGFGTMRSAQLQIFFSGAGTNEPAEIERALATGKVVITQPGRRARSEQAEYFADEDKIILTGGSPIVEDEQRGSTTGRRLTYYVGDDRIAVDSEEGTRTLTKHRVAK